MNSRSRPQRVRVQQTNIPITRRRRVAAHQPFGLFGPLDFPSIFNNDQFGSFGSDFSHAFDPAVFMNNFQGQFRSSNAFQEFLNRTAQMHEPVSTPASKEAVSKLPVLKVEEIHCKKGKQHF